MVRINYLKPLHNNIGFVLIKMAMKCIKHDRYYVFLCGCTFKNYTQKHNERKKCPVHKVKPRFIGTTCGRPGCKRHFLYKPTHGNRRLCSPECQKIVNQQHARNYWDRKKAKSDPTKKPTQQPRIKNWMSLNDFDKIYYSKGFLRPEKERKKLEHKICLSKLRTKDST